LSLFVLKFNFFWYNVYRWDCNEKEFVFWNDVRLRVYVWALFDRLRFSDDLFKNSYICLNILRLWNWFR